MKLRIQLLALLACLLTSCVPLRTFFFMMPDQKDGQRFPSTTIAQNPNQSPFEFSYQQEGKDYGDLLRMNDLGDRGVDWVSTREFIKKRYTTSFLLIRNDTILYEEYFRKSVAEEQRASFSMAKSITSMLLGIAIDEGHIQSLEQPITDFIPELAGLGEFSEVQILHLLNHTSGIKQENVVRVSDIYYGHNLLKQAKKAPFEAKPE